MVREGKVEGWGERVGQKALKEGPEEDGRAGRTRRPDDWPFCLDNRGAEIPS